MRKKKPFVWYYSGTGPNYVKCKAAFCDRSTKGLQGPHFSLRLYCKLGNKESVSCYSQTTPLPCVSKILFVPWFCCQMGSLSKVGWMFGVHLLLFTSNQNCFAIMKKIYSYSCFNRAIFSASFFKSVFALNINFWPMSHLDVEIILKVQCVS